MASVGLHQRADVDGIEIVAERAASPSRRADGRTEEHERPVGGGKGATAGGGAPPPDRAVRLRMAAARAEIATLASSAPAAMLRVPPGVVRAVASRAVEAIRVAAHLRARADVPPPLDVAAGRAAMASFAQLRAARDDQARVAEDRHRLLAVGNGAALACLLVAGLLLIAGVPMESPAVAVSVALAAAGPLAGLGVGTARLARATSEVRRRAAACSAALAAAGVETVGQLHARTFLLRAWSRRRADAERAGRTEERAAAAWRALVGDGVDPEQAEELLAAAARLRAAHLRLLALHLTHLVATCSGEKMPADAEAVAPSTATAPASATTSGRALVLVPPPPRPRPLLLWALAGAERRSKAARTLLGPGRH